MKPRVKALIAALGLVACIAASIPLIQRLSVELIELQIRQRFLDENLTLVQIAHNFSAPVRPVAVQLGLGSLSDAELSRLPVTALAKRKGQPLARFKRDLVAAVFEYNLQGTPYSSRRARR